MKRCLILVEGQTEERFVKDLLCDHFLSMNLYVEPKILVTKRVIDGPDFRGGVTSFRKFKNDILRLLHGAGNALVTTMLDYDGLPSDFPGMNTRPEAGPVERVTHVEKAIAAHFNNPKSEQNDGIFGRIVTSTEAFLFNAFFLQGIRVKRKICIVAFIPGYSNLRKPERPAFDGNIVPLIRMIRVIRGYYYFNVMIVIRVYRRPYGICVAIFFAYIRAIRGI